MEQQQQPHDDERLLRAQSGDDDDRPHSAASSSSSSTSSSSSMDSSDCEGTNGDLSLLDGRRRSTEVASSLVYNNSGGITNVGRNNDSVGVGLMAGIHSDSGMLLKQYNQAMMMGGGGVTSGGQQMAPNNNVMMMCGGEMVTRPELSQCYETSVSTVDSQRSYDSEESPRMGMPGMGGQAMMRAGDHMDKISPNPMSEYEFNQDDPSPSPSASPQPTVTTYLQHQHERLIRYNSSLGAPLVEGGGAMGDYSNGTTGVMVTRPPPPAMATAIQQQLPPTISQKVTKVVAKKTPGATRGRPRKAFVPIYQSQISGDKNAIKIRIKKSHLTAQGPTPNKKKSGRRKKHKTSDTDASDPETPTKKLKTSFEETQPAEEENTSQEQSRWATDLPENVLLQVFQHITGADGSLPVLVRLCKVCRLWRSVALTPALWHRVDLNWVKERQRTDLKLHWLIQNRLSRVRDLNLGEWKVRDIQVALEALSTHCPEMRGLNLSGWNGLNADNLKFLTAECEQLERLDLSSVNSASAMNAQPLVSLAQSMNTRLTHLVLAHNKLAGFTQIMTSISTHCSNLELLDISNIRTYAHNSALLHIEKLQTGCPKLRVLRLTNSQIWLGTATRQDQMSSPGFAALEELSLAGIEDDKTTTARCVDDDGIERILKNSTKLRLLDVRGCIRLSDSGLVRGVTAWDLEHLFLSGCSITRAQNSGLELILQKWSHSLREVDLAWTTATESLDDAVLALAEKGSESPLKILNLCGSSVNLDPVKAVLTKCPNLHSINLQSCRALPRGIKRLYTGSAVTELRESLLDRPKNTADSAVSPSGSGGGRTPGTMDSVPI